MSHPDIYDPTPPKTDNLQFEKAPSFAFSTTVKALRIKEVSAKGLIPQLPQYSRIPLYNIPADLVNQIKPPGYLVKAQDGTFGWFTDNDFYENFQPIPATTL